MEAMSEYQYYEFQAIDEPLNDREMEELREISTRATITPMSFTNSYEWGDLKAKPVKLLEKYFDVFFYFANWGTRILMFRFPKGALDTASIERYCDQTVLTLKTTKRHILVGFESDDESGDFYEELELGQLLSLRADILRGDYRSLYIGWLQSIQRELVKGTRIEPPLPPGMKKLSKPLRALIEFLRIDPDLLSVAAEQSGELNVTRTQENGVDDWVKLLSSKRKNEIIARILSGDVNAVRRQLIKEFRSSQGQPTLPPQTTKRSVTEILAAAAARSESR